MLFVVVVVVMVGVVSRTVGKLSSECFEVGHTMAYGQTGEGALPHSELASGF